MCPSNWILISQCQQLYVSCKDVNKWYRISSRGQICDSWQSKICVSTTQTSTRCIQSSLYTILHFQIVIIGCESIYISYESLRRVKLFNSMLSQIANWTHSFWQRKQPPSPQYLCIYLVVSSFFIRRTVANGLPRLDKS